MWNFTGVESVSEVKACFFRNRVYGIRTSLHLTFHETSRQSSYTLRFDMTDSY